MVLRSWLSSGVVAAMGCNAPEHPNAPTTASTRPGAPVVRIVESYGLLADGRIWNFGSGLSERLAGAVTLSSNGPPNLFNTEPTAATCFARADGVLRCYGGAVGGGLAGGAARDTCEYSPWLSFGATEQYPCAKDPVASPSAARVTQISSSCALGSDGNVLCWGRDSNNRVFGPTRVGGIDGQAVKIGAAAGASRVCAVLRDGRVACAPGNVLTPVATLEPSLEKIVELSLGWGAGCFLDAAGVARCFDELYTDVEPRTTPVRVDTDLRFEKISLSFLLTCAVTFDHRLACWSPRYEEHPLSKDPKLLPSVEHAVDVSVVSNSAFVLRDDGSVLEIVWPYDDVQIVAP